MQYSKVRTTALALAGLSLFALAGCARDSQEEEGPEPEPVQTAEPDGSIFRDDVESSVLPEIPLAPLRTRISFADGTAELTEAASAELASVAGSPQVEAGGVITLRAHGDAGEVATLDEDEQGESPSQARGEAAKAFFVENGLDETRIEIIDFGAQNPLQPNLLPDGTPNQAGRATNRRVDIEVVVPKPEEADHAETGDEAEPNAESEESE